MPTDINNPCQAVGKLIEAVNHGKTISESDLEKLRLHLIVFPECHDLINEQGEKVLRGENNKKED